MGGGLGGREQAGGRSSGRAACLAVCAWRAAAAGRVLRPAGSCLSGGLGAACVAPSESTPDSSRHFRACRVCVGSGALPQAGVLKESRLKCCCAAAAGAAAASSRACFWLPVPDIRTS